MDNGKGRPYSDRDNQIEIGRKIGSRRQIDRRWRRFKRTGIGFRAGPGGRRISWPRYKPPQHGGNIQEYGKRRQRRIRVKQKRRKCLFNKPGIDPVCHPDRSEERPIFFVIPTKARNAPFFCHTERPTLFCHPHSFLSPPFFSVTPVLFCHPRENGGPGCVLDSHFRGNDKREEP